MYVLKSISENEVKSILKLHFNFENLDDSYDNYSRAILDVFDHQLSKEEAEEILGSFERIRCQTRRLDGYLSKIKLSYLLMPRRTLSQVNAKTKLYEVFQP